MLFTTATQFVVLALVFVAGWLLGLASHPGGRRWKERYLAERDVHAALRRDHDTRLTELRNEHDARLAEVRSDRDTQVAEAERRHAELERDHARLVSAAPVTAATVVPRQERARPAFRGRDRRGWFDFRNSDA